MCVCVGGYLVDIHCIGDLLKLEVDHGHFILVLVHSVKVGVGSRTDELRGLWVSLRVKVVIGVCI